MGAAVALSNFIAHKEQEAEEGGARQFTAITLPWGWPPGPCHRGAGLRGALGTPSPANTHTPRTHGQINTARWRGRPAVPAHRGRGAALPLPVNGLWRPLEAAPGAATWRGGRNATDAPAVGGSSAQHAAFTSAQLPAQLAAPQFQAALQAFVLLQGAGRERV